MPFGAQTMVEASLRNLTSIGFGETIVVIGSDAERMSQCLGKWPVKLVENSVFMKGMATSIACGVKAASPDANGYLIALGDMPMIDHRTIKALADTFSKHKGMCIAAPFFEGRRGHPVLFGRIFREALMALEGDRGAASILERHEDCLLRVNVPDCGILKDFDTRDALAPHNLAFGKDEAPG